LGYQAGKEKQMTKVEELAKRVDRLIDHVNKIEESPVIDAAPLSVILSDEGNNRVMEQFVNRCITADRMAHNYWPWLSTAFIVLGMGLVIASWREEKAINAVAAAITNKQTAITVQPAPVALAVSGTGTVTLQAAPGDGKLHTLELRASEPCWIRVTELSPDKSVLWEASAALVAHFKEFTFDKETHVEVRSGCPGAISYRVNGVATSPTNNSGKPRDSEVVDLTL
jgi:hypothetical protein